MPPKAKATASAANKRCNNSQAKLKYINACIKTLINEMPRQTFRHRSTGVGGAETKVTYSGLPSVAPPPPRANKRKKGTPEVSSTPPCVCPVLGSSTPVVLRQTWLSELPHHPNVFLTCAFCQVEIPSLHMEHGLEQPHSRRRFTPICSSCWNAPP